MRIQVFGIVLITALSLLPDFARADSRQKAILMHNRIASVPPSMEVLNQMIALIDAGKPDEAAALATQSSQFYNVTLKTLFSPWTNEDQTSRVPLNDFTATLIGIVRDDLPFGTALHDDIIYTASAAAITANNIPAYSTTTNAHYEALEKISGMEKLLEKHKQSEVTGMMAPAGVMTTRAAGEAFYLDGTNRAVLRFTLMNFLCNDMDQLADTTLPDFRVHRDVERNPGGDSRTYKSRCVGCHNGMDALLGAFAYYDFKDNALQYFDKQVQPKFNKNQFNFPEGYVSKDDSWLNLWATGQNARLGFKGPDRGKGAAALGKLLADTEALPACMAKKVFQKVCLTEGNGEPEKKAIAELAAEFGGKSGELNMRQLFAHTAAACIK